MALKLVLVGIAAGLAATSSVLALGGGIGPALLAYIGGGMAGMAGGLASALADQNVAIAVSADHPCPVTDARHPT